MTAPATTAAAAIQPLIDQAWADREYHKARGQAGYIEAAAARIRIRALEDAIAAVRRTA